MSEFHIQGAAKLSGTFSITGAKNATTPILCAAMLVPGTVVLQNVPDILDVARLSTMLRSMGASVTRHGHSLTIKAWDIDPRTLDVKAVKRMRSSSLLISPLLARFGQLEIPEPGGCNLGKRPFEAHLYALQAFGVESTILEEGYRFHAANLSPAELTMSELSPTATENAIVMAALLPGTPTRIHNAASEPHVQDLCHFLETAGVNIEGIGTHELVIHGVKQLRRDVEYTIIPDPIETGSMICLAAASHAEITLEHAAPLSLMRMEMQKFHELGVRWEEVPDMDHGWYTSQHLRILPSKLTAVYKVHSMPHPGFPSDLLPPFATLATQAEGKTLIHEWMYEDRQKYLGELSRMGAQIEVLDPHRAIITGPTLLTGQSITSFDIRAGATLVIAALIAKGESRIANIELLDRGYEAFDQRLRALGAQITRKS